MRAVLFTDLHLHEWPEYGEQIPGKGHSRLMDGVSVLNQVSEYMDRNRIEYGFFLGDLNHIHDKMLHSVQSEVVKWARGERRKGHFWYWMLGNHDVDTLSGRYHCLDCIADYVTLVTEPYAFKLGDYRIGMIPWLTDGNDFLPAYKEVSKHDIQICFMHHDLADVPYRGRSFGRSGSTNLFKSLYFAGSGHYHDRMVVNPSFLYFGSPMQLEWGDYKKARGFYELTASGSKVTSTQIKAKYPKFVRVKESFVMSSKTEEMVRARVSGNFVRVVREGVQAEVAREKCAKLGARVAEIIDQAALQPELVPTADDDISVFDFNEVVQDYVQKMAPEGLSKKKLIRLGQQALEG